MFGSCRLRCEGGRPGTAPGPAPAGSAAGSSPLIRRDSIAGLAGDDLLDLLRNAPNNDLPLLTRVVRKGLADPFRNDRIVSTEIRHITGNGLFADHNYRAYIGLSERYAMLLQLITQLLRLTRERGHHSRVCARADQGGST